VRNDPFPVDVRVLAATGVALLVTDGRTEAWIPKSQIRSGSSIGASSERGEEGTLVIPEWLAAARGLS